MFKSFMNIFKICLPNKKQEEKTITIEDGRLTGDENNNKPLLDSKLIKLGQGSSRHNNDLKDNIMSPIICDESESPDLSVKVRDTHINIEPLKISPTLVNSEQSADKDNEKYQRGNTLFPFKKATDNILSINMKNHNIVILDSEIEYAKKLILEDCEGDLLKGLKLHIDAAGLHNGLRKMRDGHSFFGMVEKIDNECINDFILNFQSENTKKNLFHIFYDRLKQTYLLRNLNTETDKNPLYYKIVNRYTIDKKIFVMIGDILLKIENKEDKLIIQIRNKDKTTFTFDNKDNLVIIGRTKCTINIDTTSISKKHCTIQFNKENNLWEINDGYAEKSSTNGTWLWISSKIELNDDTYIKLGSNVFSIKMY